MFSLQRMQEQLLSRTQKEQQQTEVLTRIETALDSTNVNIMMADTAEDNEEAQNFFKKHGFDKEEKHVYMFKNLSEQISQGKFFNLR